MGVVVDINTAERKALCKLHGIGGALSDRIMSTRPFASWEDLAGQLGLSASALQKIQNAQASCVGALSVPAVAEDAPEELSPPSDAVARAKRRGEGSTSSDEELSDGAVADISLPTHKHLARWEKIKIHFAAEHFLPKEYFDSVEDEACARAYYASLMDIPDYMQLSRLLQKRRFGGRSKIMFPWFDRHPDGTLRCVYTGRVLSDFKGELLLKCDEEHCVPQSWQASKTAHTGRDIHQMFAAWKSANGHRGNRPFGHGTVLVEDSNFGKLSSQEGCKQTLFLPHINRGAVARGTLYVLAAYPGALDRGRVPDASLAWLVQAAAREPVTLWEKHRNAVGFAHQGNRNPFVDHPEWALEIDFRPGFAN